MYFRRLMLDDTVEAIRMMSNGGDSHSTRLCGIYFSIFLARLWNFHPRLCTFPHVASLLKHTKILNHSPLKVTENQQSAERVNPRNHVWNLSRSVIG